ncbi:MAG: bifunctional isocitrate dehydrogenase kinase/phosphatase, partial [Polaromonas sp.]|nr:bifunctional isocitrate dehydrogenase kinase/phosphatase [Polaromonas sp.]
TWTEPRDEKSGLLIRGRFHGAPVPVVVHAGRLWRAIEERVNDLPWPLHFSSLVVSAPEDADLLDAAFWQSHKERIAAGHVYDVFPYEQERRFMRKYPAASAAHA